MSLFKEKDEFIKNIFNHLENYSDDEETETGAGDIKEEDKQSGDSGLVKDEAVKHEQPIKKVTSKKARLLTSGESNASSPEMTPPESRSSSKRNQPSKQAGDGVTSTSDVLCITLSDESANHDYDLITLDDSDDEAIQGLSERLKASNPSVDTTNPGTRCEVIDQIQNNEDAQQETQDLNRDYNLKIIMDSTYKSYKTTYNTILSVAIEPLLSDLKKSGKDLVLALKGKEVSLAQTPASLNLEPGSLLKAIIVNNQSARPGTISVKLQDGNRKHNKNFNIETKSCMSDLKMKYLQEYNLEPSTKIRLMFDGDVVDDEATPEELDIEDGCVIDVMFC